MLRQVERILTERSAWWVKVHGDASQSRGVPDLLVCINGRFVALEGKQLKTRERDHEQLQEYTREKIRAAGGIAEVIRSVTDLETILERYDLSGK